MAARKKAARKKAGRKRVWERGEALGDAIVERYLDPTNPHVSLATFCNEDPELPGAWYVWSWMADDKRFAAKITRAKELLAERIQGDQYRELSSLVLDPNDAAVNARVTLASKRFDAAVKISGQFAPRVYSPRMKLEEGGAEPLAERLEQAAKRVAARKRKGAKSK